MACSKNWLVSFRFVSFPVSIPAFITCRLTGLENGKQVVKRTGVVGHKSLGTKRLVS